MLESQVESDFTQDQLPGKTANEEGVRHERISTGLQFYIHPQYNGKLGYGIHDRLHLPLLKS